MNDNSSRPGSLAPTAGPRPTTRSLAPDLARGLLLAWIAVANVMIFLTDRPYGYRQHIVEHDLVDRVTSVVVVTLVDGRAYPLFAFLFGYGVIQLLTAQRSRGVDEAGRRRILRRRALGLIIIGFVHALVLFPGDILGTYGILTLVLLALVHRPDRRLVRLALWTAVIATVVNGLIYGAPGTGDRSFLWSMDMGPSDLASILIWRPVEWLMSPFALLQVVPAAVLGVVAARRHVLEQPARHLPLLRGVALVGLPLAVVGGLPSGLAVIGVLDVDGLAVGEALAALHSLTGLAGGLGLVAAIGWVAASSSEGPITRCLAALGRNSLSGYLALSAVFAVLLHPLFLGLGATLGTTGAAVLALLTWVVTIVAAVALDRRGRRGPAELALRRLTYPRVRDATT